MDFPLINKSWKKGMNTFDIIFPNKKFGGSYNLGVLIIYNLINNFPNWICNRIFLDEGKITSKILGFTFQYELDYHNFFKLLEKNNIPKNKNEREQIILAGGPYVNANQKALQDYIDLFVLGDSEEIMPQLLKAYEERKDKQSFLKSVSKIEGVFVPGITKEVKYACVEDLDKLPYPLYQPLPEKISKEYVFGKAFILEVERGCPFRCKFCPMPLRRKVKHRSLENIKKIIVEGIKINKRKKVVIYTPSFAHPQRKEILKYLLSKNLEFSVPSIRMEIVDKELMNLIKKGGQKTLTIAPECNEELRFKIGKSIRDKAYFNFVELAKEIGFPKIKAYFMIGIPEQTDKDIKEMIILIKELKKRFNNLYISINPFVPKPKTELEKHEFNIKTLKNQAKLLKKELYKEKINFKLSSIKSAYKEWELSHKS
ncbi:MAG: B12-binding domain-containing radical SAM protein [Nanoarchaeota archaeon]|nr:B12-binding domain-containing radical SAM protein [Nanoarchaeota archaeon]MBU4242537.1 B12-binding domain-containing radical SAM protein [Nanoarchaeota archaeon]MBU4351556.1 B12-binding domain-containing radical SAM protein [Nanoarchaeota archaeon]MBU4455878.1 B12-binding domain-containing radical SAM protein [Nanoarchaeota archaeon]MCG2719744.1 B12-binding domain-containing radical SAM protein [Nanoarchaeota archaeon]